MPQDDELIGDALERIRGLERALSRDGDAARTVFFLFHRRRLWNPAQGCWMGWERKRGKLLEFNRLLRGARDTSYSVLSADPSSLPRIRFVITLDADTQMPRDTAGRLVGTLAHPLNRPRFDAVAAAGRRRLRRAPAEDQLPPGGGHALAIRRAAGDLRRHRPLFDGRLRRLHGSLRRRQVHRQGDLRRRRLRGGHGETFPENRILSHDLIEGNYAALRAAERHRALRRLPGPLPRLCPPRAPLGPRRLAAPALAGPGGSPDARGGWRAEPAAAAVWSAGSCWTTSAAAWCRPRSAGAPGPGLDGPARLAVVLDGGGPGRLRAAAVPVVSWAS